MVLWDDIRRKFSGNVVFLGANYGNMILLPVTDSENEKSCWLIGRYFELTKLATDLRSDKNDQREFTGKNKVRLGLRKDDVAPLYAKRQISFGNIQQGKNAGVDFTQERFSFTSRPVKEGNFSINRRTDRERNVHNFWATQTPQSHHIVEFNHLRNLGVSKLAGTNDLDHSQLPCVLFVAEFHQRYISSILKQTHGLSQTDLRTKLEGIYKSLYLYKSPLFEPLWEVSKIILQHAGIKVR